MADPRWTRFGRISVLAVVGLALSACGAAPSAGPTPPDAPQIPKVGDPAGTATAGRTGSATDVATASPQHVENRSPSAIEVAAPDVAADPQRQELDQPAIWPAADVVFATPEEAAADFVSSVLISEGDPVLGEFRRGDARSGEIPVLFAGETGDLDPPQEQGLLLLRQIPPTDGWYVIAATSDGAVIDTPSASEEVPAGTVTVSGEGRGFEGTLVVSAFPPGDASATFDREIGAGGAFEELEPFSVELDLSGAPTGEAVVILVQGDTGLGNDPGTFAAIPVVVGSAPSETIPPTK